jgi:bacteriocin biosynthesis cyclodehydratase domain-containing protein
VLRPGLRADSVGRDLVFVLGERERRVLSNPHMRAVVSLVDGQRSVRDVLEEAGAVVNQAKALYILTELAAAGYLVPPLPAAIDPPTAAFWSNSGVDARAAIERLDRSPVSVRFVADGRFVTTMTEALEQAGIRIDESAPFQVVLTDHPLRAKLAEINENALRERRRWLLVTATGSRPLIGPLFVPGIGPCWQCLSFWMRGNQPVEETLRRHTGSDDPIIPPMAFLDATSRTACGLAAVALARLLASEASATDGVLFSALLELDLVSFAMKPHAVVRRPQCPACGEPSRMAAVGTRRVELESVPKCAASEGGHRRQSARETYERYRHLISPLTGPVSYVVPARGRDTEVRAVYASGYLSRPLGEPSSRNVYDRVCAGKGRSSDQARASALCEALERYSSVYQGDEARVRASSAEIGSAVVGPESLLNFSDKQLSSRDGRSDDGADLGVWVPKPLGRSLPIDWTPAWSLTRDERKYVPLSYCFALSPVDSGTDYCRPCGNGVAAGTCREEAILQGFLELVERDAVGIWWYNRVPRPAVELAGFRDTYFESVRKDYARLGWRVWVLDLTHDLGIPVCAALAHHSDGDRFSIGFGCHLEGRLAVERALTELNQLFDPHGTSRAPWSHERLPRSDYLFPNENLPATDANGMTSIASQDLREDVRACVSIAERAGLEVLVVDKTRPDIELHVAQVIVPGLRHFWPRFAPGRLYEVPHTLGWLPRRLSEDELNAVPLFL